ncbi:histone-fold-containing protein, partial [Jimgerdemannia flammicorona]
MFIINSFVNDIFKYITTEASKLAAYNKKSTILSYEIQTAVHLILSDKLTKYAIFKETKAIMKYTSF